MVAPNVSQPFASLLRGSRHPGPDAVAGQTGRHFGALSSTGDRLASGLAREGVSDPAVPVDAADRQTARIEH